MGGGAERSGVPGMNAECAGQIADTRGCRWAWTQVERAGLGDERSAAKRVAERGRGACGGSSVSGDGRGGYQLGSSHDLMRWHGV